ncbi:8-amino-7-oxononanoate synthase [Novacetimonas hansenii]|uniref:aminotransferase class I/II-fold pyridoxal phosphate-dependent enzyme n=1 Tax=Novacetimonas hansenii TaxID=436 RepID=UPI001782891C|nr:8-amino-7-oxononanoate synthase [Novacetimonas hansenii]MBL7236618.1 8-amino-7-oxononanoate synthase [Novacetimonas hansenii]QOF96426.1 8-amino-7-oxononanoate synthase [Novacetimonas hansenii]
MTRFDIFFQTALNTLEQDGIRRTPATITHRDAVTIMRDGQMLLDFSSNDYLGLAHHPLLIERACEWGHRWGSGSGASRLVSGTTPAHRQVEARLADFKQTQAALLFASGWQANASVLPALCRLATARMGEAPLVFTDRLNHASLHHGCQAACIRQIRFRHNDLDHLSTLLETHRDRPGMRFIVTESVFSMDGDRVDILALRALADAYDAFLYLDEAHATGVLGPQGRGLSGLTHDAASQEAGSQAAHAHGVDLVMGTFSKAMGSFGAYVAGSRALCEWLSNCCSGFVYTTALPPANLGAIDAALELVPLMETQRRRLQENARTVRQAIHECGLSTGASNTQIIPIEIGDTPRTMDFAAILAREGILGIPIRPPSVPPNGSRIRLALSAAHDDAMIATLIAAIRTAAQETRHARD